jgi:light-regulated signal transduction histidine kinase (bacteriophytochrome)
LCGIVTDITERKAAADVLRELTANLERRVARRTRDLAEVNRELEAFAYSVSHDLRAPLMTVHGFADLLLRDYAPSLDQTAQKYVHRIRDGAKRMTGLIEDLLSLSRVTRMAPQRASLNVATLAHDAVKTLREAEPLRTVVVDIAPDMPANADASLIAVVMNNLLGNAWKYTSKRSDAHIEVGATQQNGESVYFVRDNGAGFDPRYAERLFQPFKRLHSEQEFPGNGIGLATVARIIHRHGGRIWADGKPQQGATFYFTLPTPDEDANEDGAHKNESITA